MSSKRSRRHHYVPETLQKHFLNTEKQIWFADREDYLDAYSKVEARNPRSCFYEKDFYTVLQSHEKRTDRIEKGFYEPLDNHLSQLLDELHQILGSGRVPVFQGSPKESLDNLMIGLFKRTKDSAKLVDEREAGREIFESLGNLSCHDTEGGSLSKSVLGQRVGSHDYGRHARVLAMASFSAPLVGLLRNYRVVFARAYPRGRFILGSRITYRTSNGSTEPFGSPEVELWMPISPEWCLVRVHESLVLPDVVDCPQSHIRQFNQYVIRSSLGIASHSDRLLNSLLGRRS